MGMMTAVRPVSVWPYDFVRMNDRLVPAAQPDHETDESCPERARDPGDEYEEQREARFILERG